VIAIARACVDLDQFSAMSENQRDWMVEQKGFESPAPTSPFHRKIVRGFGDKFAED
jgi:hypothetical protein